MSLNVHPLLRLTATDPHLLAEHLEAYAELVMARGGYALRTWRRRVALTLAATAFAVIAVLLSGVALMFWAVMPADGIRQPIVLIAIPCAPALAAIGCWLFARVQRVTGVFDELRGQLHADVLMLREAGSA